MSAREALRQNRKEIEDSLGRKASHDWKVFSELRARAAATGFYIDQKQLLRHTLILGSTGSGKTNQVFHLIMEAMRHADWNTSVIVIDPKREYRELRNQISIVNYLSIGGEPKYQFNPLFPPEGVDAEHWDRAFADVFTRAYGLSEPSRRIILDSLFQLRHDSKDSPTLRELERAAAAFDSGSSREENSKRSLESRLHIINTGPLGDSLNCMGGLELTGLEGKVTIYEIGEVDSLRDQRFVAELLLAYIWQHDRANPWEAEEKLRRLVVVEEAHRYLSEERPPEQRGDRTLLELAIAEARRYGWGFVIVDQMPLLLSRYVWDNVGTTMVHRLTNIDSYRAASKVFPEDPTGLGSWQDEKMAQIILKLPENLAVFKEYIDYGSGVGSSTGITDIPKVK